MWVLSVQRLNTAGNRLKSMSENLILKIMIWLQGVNTWDCESFEYVIMCYIISSIKLILDFHKHIVLSNQMSVLI